MEKGEAGESDRPRQLRPGRCCQLRALLLSPFTGQKLTTFVTSEKHQDLDLLKDLIEAGQLTPVIDRTYPLDQAPDALQYLQDGHTRGKLVLTVRTGDAA